jgi:hypothetical protein
MATPYNELQKGSLFGGSQLSNGLQTTAIYWETWQTPFRGMFGGLYGGKWSWKNVDGDIRSFFGLAPTVSSSDSLSYNDGSLLERTYLREYEGSSDFFDVSATRKRSNFSFFATSDKTF